MELSQLQQRYNQAANQAAQYVGQYNLVLAQYEEASKQVEAAESTKATIDQGLQVLREMGGQARERLTSILNPLGQQALREVFDEQARFEIRFRPLPKSGYAARIVSGVGEQLGAPVATDGNSVSSI